MVVVQSNDFNDSGISTVVGVIVTANTRLAAAPGNVLLSRRSSRLPRVSVANVSQLVTVDRSLLLERVSTLPGDILERIDEGLRLVLAL
jgi:mRNA interferase MazF